MKGYLYTKLLVLTSTNFCTKCSCHLKMWIFSSSNARLLARNETTSFSAAFFATFFRKPWNPKEFILLKIIPSPDNLIFEPIRCFGNLRKCPKYALGQKTQIFVDVFQKYYLYINWWQSKFVYYIPYGLISLTLRICYLFCTIFIRVVIILEGGHY